MFEKEIKFIVDFNLNKLRKSGTFFTLDKLISAGVHPAIVKYISAELDLMIHEDRKRLLNNSMFDYSGGEITKHFDMITRELKKSKRISFEDIKKLVIQAVSFNANHVVRPRWSLSKLIFDPSPSRTVEEIKLLLEYPYYYDFVKNILLSYFSRKKITSLSQNEFESVLSNLDQELFSGGSRKFIDNALNSISDFFNEGAAVKDKLAPELVLNFLKEKNLNELTGRLRQSLAPDGKQKYNLSEIRSILYGSAREVQQVSGKEAEPQTNKETIVEETLEDEIIQSSVEDIPPAETEIDDQFVKVTSKLPLIGHDFEVEEEVRNETTEKFVLDIVYKTEEEIAEEIKLPVVEDNPFNPPAAEDRSEEEQEIETEIPDAPAEIDLDREASLTLPDNEIEKLNNDDEEKELSGKEVESDEDEIKFDLEQKDKLDELYEFEEEKEMDEISDADLKDFPDDFNLKDLESELKQIEEQFNIQPESITGRRTKIEEPEKSNVDDIFKFLSDREIDRIISNIFNDDRDDFTNTLEKVSECNTYERATEILKSVFLTYRINPYSRDAVTLTNAISKYFDAK